MNHQPLSAEERDGIIVAVQSVFRKARNLYAEVEPIFTAYGFTPLSSGVMARDLSEKIEQAIVQHCPTFRKGIGHADLERHDEDWEVKICLDSGLTINQSSQIHGEHYIVVNYAARGMVRSVWILWEAEDHFFSVRRPNSNARALLARMAAEHIEPLLGNAFGNRVRNAARNKSGYLDLDLDLSKN